MARAPALPFLPGFTFNPNIGRTNFRMNPKFDFISDNVPCMVEKVKPNLFGPWTDKYPSFYPRGEVVELPAWIAFDKQILCFDAFFQETLQEFSNIPFQVRVCKIYFFLEDGTIQVIEPKIDNSGAPQGTVISRQRIRFPAPMDENFYDIMDFNVGREVELYGKVFKITNCDKFTRYFLNRNGIAVPDPITAPVDPYMNKRSHDRDGQLPKKPNRKVDTFGKFLSNDRKVLRFYGYWDDRKSEFGEFHDLEIHYYLADDTVEIKEIVQPNSGRDVGAMFLRRSKLPKLFKGLPGFGVGSPITVLNVLGPGLQGGRYVTDTLDCGREIIEYYADNDLIIGGVLNCYGRRIVLTDSDPYTKEYYRARYGFDNFKPLAKPADLIVPPCHSVVERELPPWNGYGTYEDSAQNCVTVELKPLLKDFKKFLQYDKEGMDSRILRYEARMVSRIMENCDRIFIISYYLCDDTMQVFEIPRKNSGFFKSCFFARKEVILPGQKTHASNRPEVYKPQHLFVGAQIIINSFHFVLIGCDEYALRYMEINCYQFPKSDIKLIMGKLREKLRPIYKDFVGEMIPTKTTAISYEDLRSKLCPIMGEEFSEHEMITISRAFSANCIEDRFNRDAIRAITLTELKRNLWDELDRLKEYFLVRDAERTGKLPRKEVYTLLRGCRLPVDTELMEKILKVVKKDDECNIIYNDLFEFLDRTKCPLADVIPINVKSELWWASEIEPEMGQLIDWCEFNKTLDLESVFHEKILKTTLSVPQVP